MMRIVSTVVIGLGMTLLPPIGSGGTGLMTSGPNHVDRALFAANDGRVADLRSVDDAVVRAVAVPAMLARPAKIDAGGPPA